MLEAFDDEMPPELHREYLLQRIVQETNWTYEYVESLSHERISAFWAVRGGQTKAAAHRASVRNSRAAARRARSKK